MERVKGGHGRRNIVEKMSKEIDERLETPEWQRTEDRGVESMMMMGYLGEK